MDERKIRVAITHGDTNGVGYELIYKVFSAPEMLELCTPIVYGSPKIAAYYRKALNTEAAFSIISNTDDVREGRMNLLTCFDDEVKVEMGHPTPESAEAGRKALTRALADMKDGRFDGLVLAPLADNVQTIGQGLLVLMNENLRVAIATKSRSLKDVAAEVTKENLVAQASALHGMLKRDLRISNPRVAMLSLNPGCNGTEEAEAIVPAISELVASGKQVFGPYAADDFFGTGKYEAFDAVLAMYHDQGVAPFKALSAEENISYVAGLQVPVAITSIGPSYDQVGRGLVDENSLRHAIYNVIDVARNRTNYDIPLANPLPKLYHEKRDESEKVRFAIPKKRENKEQADDKDEELKAENEPKKGETSQPKTTVENLKPTADSPKPTAEKPKPAAGPVQAKE